MRGIGAAIALLIAVASFAGCGGDGSDGDSAERSSGPGDDAAVPRRFKAEPAKWFAIARGVCGAQPKSEYIEETGEVPMGSSDLAVARAYAAELPRRLRPAAVAGCLDGLSRVPDRPLPSAPEADALWGSEFAGVSVSAVAGAKEPPLERADELRLSFSDPATNSLGWSGLCNSHGGRVRITADHLEVRNTGGTLVGCPDGREEEDQWVFEFLDAGPAWRLDGDRLVLSIDSAELVLERPGP